MQVSEGSAGRQSNKGRRQAVITLSPLFNETELLEIAFVVHFIVAAWHKVSAPAVVVHAMFVRNF